MKFLRLLWKAIVVFTLIIVLTFGTAAALTYFYRDKIIGILITEMNKYLATEINVDKIDLNLYEKFPYLSLKFSGVKIKEPAAFGKSQMASAGEIYFTFNPVNILQEKYHLENIYIENALINLIVNEKGQTNYDILKEDSSATTKTNKPVSFELKKVSLENVTVNYHHLRSKQTYGVLHRNATAKLAVLNDEYSIFLEGDLHVHDINVSGNSYFKNKDIIIKSSQKYSVPGKFLEIYPSHLQVEKSLFNVAGKYEFKDNHYINMKIEGEKGKVQTLLSILPTDVYKKLSNYENSGNIYFTGQIIGEVSEHHNPLIKVDFGFEDATFTHPTTRTQIKNADLKGYFTNGDRRKPETSILKISKFRGDFQNNPFTGTFLLTNFKFPYVELNCNGLLELGPLFQFYPVPEIINPSGTVKADFSFAGKITDIQHNPNKIRASGEVVLNNASFSLKDFPHSFSNLSGNFLFNKNDVAVGDFKGRIANSDFLLNGYFRNLIGKLLFDEERMIVEANFESDLLDINTLLKQSSGDGMSREVKSSGNNPMANYMVKLDCHIGLLKYNKLKIRNIKGSFDMIHPYFNFQNVRAGLCGGDVQFNAKVILNDLKEIRSEAEISNIMIDSLFSAFGDFDQNFITSKQIKGSLSGKFTEFYTSFNRNNDLIYNDIEGKVKLSIKNGQLINFAPMQKLSRFVEEKELADIRFKEIQNEFFIVDNKLYIPKMQIISNISEISIMGSHTFDNYLDYQLTVPLKNFSKKDKDEAFGAVDNDSKGVSKVHLLLKGHVDDYKITYDRKATQTVIKNDIKKQGNEIRKIFDGRAKQEEKDKSMKKATLNVDETFNFDE